MRILGNILWHFPFMGFMSALMTFLFGALLTALIIPAPIGLGLIQLSKFLLAPYSYEMVTTEELNREQNAVWQAYSFIILLFYLPFGLILAFIGALQAVALFFTIVGIPIAIPVAKSLGTYLNPVGKVCVSVGVGRIVQEEKIRKEAEKYMK